MKGSRIFCLILVGLLAGTSVDGAGRKWRSPEELVNVLLGPGLSQWLVGPIARLATEEEIETYLAITEDETAERFIDEFWAGRRPAGETAGQSARQQFEHLAEEADRLFSEATFRGRYSDRGTIFILYGPPDDIQHKPARSKGSGGRFRDRPMSPRYGLVERWLYDEGRVGLDGRSPRRAYRFVRRGDLTRFAPGSER